MVHLICHSYPKFRAVAPRQTGVITRCKKWGRLIPPASRGLTDCSISILLQISACVVHFPLLAVGTFSDYFQGYLQYRQVDICCG